MPVIRPRNRTPALGKDSRAQSGRHTQQLIKMTHWPPPPPLPPPPTAPCFSGKLSSKFWFIIYSMFFVYFQRLYRKGRDIIFDNNNKNTLKFSISIECRLCLVSKKSLTQSVLNDLKRIRLFCGGRMIQLLAHPHPHPTCPVSKLSLFLSLSVCCRSSLLMGGGGRGAISYDREKA